LFLPPEAFLFSEADLLVNNFGFKVRIFTKQAKITIYREKFGVWA